MSRSTSNLALEAAAAVHRVIPNVQSLQERLRKLRRPGRALPLLAGRRLGREAVLQVVQAIGVELLLEWERGRARAESPSDAEAGRLLRLLDVIGSSHGMASAKSEASPPDPDVVRQRWTAPGECGWRSSAEAVGSVVICLWTRDTATTFVHCGDGFQKHVFRVVRLLADNSAEVVEEDFLTYADAVAAYPEAAVRA